LSILWIKSSLSTFLPCLPGLAFTENIKNLHLSALNPPYQGGKLENQVPSPWKGES